MKLTPFLQWITIFFILVAFTSCSKKYTVFYEDNDAEDLSVFSDKGNDVMTCYINGKPFRTRDRVLNGGFVRAYLDGEIKLHIIDSAANSDTLVIDWIGNQPYNPDHVSLVLAVKKGFSRNDINSLNNNRLLVDGVNGYFMVNNNRLEKGTGNIYFHKAIFLQFDSSEANNIFSGIFEATLPSYKITRGRFDHILTSAAPENVVFF